MMLTADIFTDRKKIARKAADVSQMLKNKDLESKCLEELANMFVDRAKDLGIIPANMNATEIGDRAMCAESNDFELDGDKSYRSWVVKIAGGDWGYTPSTASDEEKLLKGIEVSVGVFIEKYSELIFGRFCSSINNCSEEGTLSKMVEVMQAVVSNSQELDKRIKLVKDKVYTEADDDSFEKLEKVLSQTDTQDKILDTILLSDESKQKDK